METMHGSLSNGGELEYQDFTRYILLNKRTFPALIDWNLLNTNLPMVLLAIVFNSCSV